MRWSMALPLLCVTRLVLYDDGKKYREKVNTKSALKIGILFNVALEIICHPPSLFSISAIAAGTYG